MHPEIRRETGAHESADRRPAGMQRRLSVLVASSNGMAWRICGFTCEFLRTEFADIELLDAGSTRRRPGAAQPFPAGGEQHLRPRRTAEGGAAAESSLRECRVDLSGIVFGVVCLGDRSFRETFCRAAARWKELLGFGGARFAGPELKLDMCNAGSSCRAMRGRAHGWPRSAVHHWPNDQAGTKPDHRVLSSARMQAFQAMMLCRNMTEPPIGSAFPRRRQQAEGRAGAGAGRAAVHRVSAKLVPTQEAKTLLPYVQGPSTASTRPRAPPRRCGRPASRA